MAHELSFEEAFHRRRPAHMHVRADRLIREWAMDANEAKARFRSLGWDTPNVFYSMLANLTTQPPDQVVALTTGGESGDIQAIATVTRAPAWNELRIRELAVKPTLDLQVDVAAAFVRKIVDWAAAQFSLVHISRSDDFRAYYESLGVSNDLTLQGQGHRADPAGSLGSRKLYLVTIDVGGTKVV